MSVLLRDDFVHDFPMDVGQSKVSTRMAVGQLFVIEAHEMQNCGMKIVDVNSIFLDVIARALH